MGSRILRDVLASYQGPCLTAIVAFTGSLRGGEPGKEAKDSTAFLSLTVTIVPSHPYAVYLSVSDVATLNVLVLETLHTAAVWLLYTSTLTMCNAHNFLRT